VSAVDTIHQTQSYMAAFLTCACKASAALLFAQKNKDPDQNTAVDVSRNLAFLAYGELGKGSFNSSYSRHCIPYYLPGIHRIPFWGRLHLSRPSWDRWYVCPLSIRSRISFGWATCRERRPQRHSKRITTMSRLGDSSIPVGQFGFRHNSQRKDLFSLI
jgi:hypothetical protein